MQKQELKNTFIDTLERERTIRGWTQWEMAEKLEMERMTKEDTNGKNT